MRSGSLRPKNGDTFQPSFPSYASICVMPWKRSLGAHFVGSLLYLRVAKFDLPLYRHQQLSGCPQRLQVVQRGRATLSLDVLGEQVRPRSAGFVALRENCRTR